MSEKWSVKNWWSKRLLKKKNKGPDKLASQGAANRSVESDGMGERITKSNILVAVECPLTVL